MERTILFIDDEENILRSLNRLCRRDGYHILTATSGQQGLDILKENSVNVVISDYRMPVMNGVDILAIVKELYPNIVRIMLSGYAGYHSAADALDQGVIYKFISKPWDDAQLRAEIKEAIDRFPYTA